MRAVGVFGRQWEFTRTNVRIGCVSNAGDRPLATIAESTSAEKYNKHIAPLGLHLLFAQYDHGVYDFIIEFLRFIDLIPEVKDVAQFKTGFGLKSLLELRRIVSA